MPCADAREACQQPRSLIGLGHGRELGVKGSNAPVEFVPTRTYVTVQEHQARTELTRTGVQQVRKQAAQSGMASGDDVATLCHTQSDLPVQRQAIAIQPMPHPVYQLNVALLFALEFGRARGGSRRR